MHYNAFDDDDDDDEEEEEEEEMDGARRSVSGVVSCSVVGDEAGDEKRWASRRIYLRHSKKGAHQAERVSRFSHLPLSRAKTRSPS